MVLSVGLLGLLFWISLTIEFVVCLLLVGVWFCLFWIEFADFLVCDLWTRFSRVGFRLLINLIWITLKFWIFGFLVWFWQWFALGPPDALGAGAFGIDFVGL